DATHVDALVGLAWVQSARHEFEKSIESARKALGLAPANAAAYGLLGDAALELGEYDLAGEHYQRMLDLRPDISAYSRTAHLLLVTGDVRRATRLMGKAINAGAPYAENTAWCRAQLALMHLATGNLLAAEQTVEQAISRAPNNYHVLFAQGRVRAARANYAGAIDSYRRASAIAPQHEVVVALGQLYVVTEDRKSAEQQWALVETIGRWHKGERREGGVQLARVLADLDPPAPGGAVDRPGGVQAPPERLRRGHAGLGVLQERPVRGGEASHREGARPAHARRELSLPPRGGTRQAS